MTIPQNQNNTSEAAQQRIQMASAIAYIGPLPHPEAFEKYEKTLSGAANRILQMAESEANHRREIEKNALLHNIWIAHLSQIFAFILGIVGLGGSVYCIVNNQPWAGAAIGGASLGALVSAFLIKR